MADRHSRVKALIERNIRDIVAFEVKDPKVGFVVVNEVEVYDDLSGAKVYVSFLDTKYPRQKTAELQKSAGFVRSSLAKKMDIYKVPKIFFVYDESAEKAAKIDAALAKEASDLAALPGQEDEQEN